MNKKIIALAISVILVSTMAIAITVYPSGPAPIITGAAIGTGWELAETEELENGIRWVYVSGEEKLTFREREFETGLLASKKYIDTFLSDKTHDAELFSYKHNAYIGLYYHDFYDLGPWLMLKAQEDKTIYEIIYTNGEKNRYGSTNIHPDVEWLKELAKTTFGE